MLLEEVEEKRIILTVATTCGSLSSFTLLYYCCCCNGRRAGQCEEEGEEYIGIGSNHFVLKDFFALFLPLMLLLLWYES